MLQRNQKPDDVAGANIDQAAGMNIVEVVLLPSGEIRLLNGANRAHAEQRANDFDRDFS